jgi:hypothetical protein
MSEFKRKRLREEKEWTIELENEDVILKEIPDLKCPICLFILNEPTQTPCDHLFCHHCIYNALEFQTNCPLCRKHIELKKLQSLEKRNVATYRLIFNYLQVKCPVYRDDGCEWKGKYSTMNNHVEHSCVKTRFECCYCAQEVKREAIDLHKTNDCLHWPIVCSQAYEKEFCKETVSRRNLAKHQREECSFRSIECPLECKATVVYKHLADHYHLTIEKHLSLLLKRPIDKIEMNDELVLSLLANVSSPHYTFFIQVLIYPQETKFIYAFVKVIDEFLSSSSALSAEQKYTIDDIMCLFRCFSKRGDLHDFRHIYRGRLATRLFNGIYNYKNVKLEEDLISGFSSISESKWSTEVVLLKEYKESRLFESKCAPCAPFKFNVVTTPPIVAQSELSSSNRCHIPKSLIPACDSFTANYIRHHQSVSPAPADRKLHWQLQLGNAEIEVVFSPIAVVTLQVSTIQMMIMLAFENGKIQSFKDFQEVTGFSAIDLATPLLSLAHPKVGVLLKRPNTSNLLDDHQFMINPRWDGPKYFKVPLFNLKKKTPEQRASQLSRQYVIENFITREMKVRRELPVTELCARVICEIAHRLDKVKSSEIKKCIEKLIEKEYLERRPGDLHILRYLC